MLLAILAWEWEFIAYADIWAVERVRLAKTVKYTT